MAAKLKKQDMYYSRVLVSKGTRFTVVVAVFGSMVAVAYLLAQTMANHASWGTVGVPIGLIGLGLIAIPLIEDWEYRPWQNAPMRYEHNV